MPCRSASSASWHPTFQPSVLQGWTSSQLCPRLGGLAEDTISTIRSLWEAIAQRVNPQNSSTCIKQLFYRVAIALWRGNACLWLHRQPTLPPSSGWCSLVYLNFFFHLYSSVLLLLYFILIEKKHLCTELQ